VRIAFEKSCKNMRDKSVRMDSASWIANDAHRVRCEMEALNRVLPRYVEKFL